MRGGWRLAVVLLAVVAAGCIGGVDEASDDLDEAGLAEASGTHPDHALPASAEAEIASALPASSADPSAEGPLAIEAREFDFGYTIVSDSDTGLTYPVKVNGSVTYPTEGKGPHPIVVFLHGRHFTCQVAGAHVLGTQACPDAGPVEPIDSYQGYGYIAETLASHGFVVASVDANEVNDRDAAYQRLPEQEPADGRYLADLGVRARAQLVLRTLDGFEQVDAGEDPAPLGGNGDLVDALGDRIDMESVGLVGHSRGGDGVTYAVPYNENRTQGEPHAIDAVFAIAPTDFRATTVRDVAYATLLPSCDGDVYNLQGARVYDRSRYVDEAGPLHQFVAMGANHAFYNTVWTDNIDDAAGYEDPFCGAFREDGGGRLAPADQRRHGEALVNAFLFTYVADEPGHEPWLQGRQAPPSAACPADVGACPTLIQTSYHPPAEDRLVVDRYADGEAGEENDLGGEVTVDGLEATACTPPDDCPGSVNRQRATQVHLAWEQPGRYELAIPAEHRDLTAYEGLSVRASVPSTETDVGRLDVSLALADADGTEQAVGLDAYGRPLYEPIGETDGFSESQDVTLNAVWIPLDRFDRIDTTDVAEIAIVTDRSPQGGLQVTDVMLQR